MSKRKIAQDFEPVEIKKETTVKGGLLSKPLTLPVLEVQVGDTKMEFVSLNKRQDWLCRMVSGIGSYSRPLARVKLIDTLQSKIRRAIASECDETADDENSDEETNARLIDDPMSALDFGDDFAALGKSKGQNKKGKKKGNRKNVMLRVMMPREPQEKNPNSNQKKEISVWLTNQLSVWICIEDLPWAVQFMHDQYLLGGVSTVVEDGLPSASPAKSKNIRWDFNSGCWVATIDTGSTTKERRLKPSQLNAQEASTFVDQNVCLTAMAYEDLKQTSFLVLQAWLDQHSEC